MQDEKGIRDYVIQQEKELLYGGGMTWERVADEVDDLMLVAPTVEVLATHLAVAHGAPPFHSAPAEACAMWARGIDYCEACRV